MESKCEMCRFRYSWDCDDGLAYPKNGCEYFKLDMDTLSDNQRDLLIVMGLLEDTQDWW